MRVLYVYFVTTLLYFLTMGTTLYGDTEDPFVADILTPYKDYYRTKRTHRFVRDCQPIERGNTTHEIFNVSRLLNPEKPFVQVNNFYHEFNRDGKTLNVVGRIVTVENPIRTISVLEPKEVGGCSKFTRATVAETGKQRNCFVSTNGGMFRTRDGMCYGNIFSDGRKVQDSSGVQNANFGIRQDGTLVVGYLSEEDVLRKENPFIQLVSGVVWLLRNGSSYVNESKKAECRETEETGPMDLFAGVLSARTALGHDSQGRVVMVQVDGKTNKRGIDLYSFADLLLKFGLVNAINLDGGGSSTMVVNGTVVNYPSDQCGKFNCPRQVTTIVCAHEPDCVPRNCNGHGQCVMGRCVCDSQWTGESCDVVKCKENNCSSNGVCSQQDGCLCFSGWRGDNCSEACPPGLYGVNCSRECLCLNGGTCNRLNGECSCSLGWTGLNCQHRCFPGSYGQNCSMICDCPNTCDCDPETGECLSAHNNTLLNATQKWLQCQLDLRMSKSLPTSNTKQPNTEKVVTVEKEFRRRSREGAKTFACAKEQHKGHFGKSDKLFVWFIAVISLCGISLLANLILIYLACNQASRSAVWTLRMGERQLLFSDDDNEL